MEFIDKDSILRDIPLFANLSDEERALVNERSILLDIKKGQIIYNEGSCADALYCIVVGRVVIYAQDAYNKEAVLEYLHRGKYFGIISLLTKDPHSVTAKAINDCILLVIRKEDFDFILDKIPKLAIDLSQTLSRRLKRKDIHQKTIFESTIISVFSACSQAGKTIYALNFAISLKQETRKPVLILDIASFDNTHSLPGRLGIESGYPILNISQHMPDTPRVIKDFILKNKFSIDLICLHYKPEDSISLKRFLDILSLLVNDYSYIILDLPVHMDAYIFNILNQSDLIHILTLPEHLDLEKTHNLIERLKVEFHFQESKINIILNEYNLSKLTHRQHFELLEHNIFATLPKIEFQTYDRLVLDDPDGEYARAIRRISRKVGDRLVGLALGVGVGYGFCHIGVLRVIEEEKIPIDVIVGSSIGAVIASLWATGRSSEEILEITKEFRQPKNVWNMVDLTFPWLGFIKGNKLYNFLKKYLNNKTFYDIKLPLKIIASDVRRKESKIFDKGLLIDAIMASCAMPGIFRPFKPKQELLLDGGVINPLPTEALFKIGVRKIIAVDVTPSRQDIAKQYDKMKEEIAPSDKKGIKAGLFSIGDKVKTNIIDIIFSSIEVMQAEIAEKEGQLADIVLHPDTQGMYWLELHRAEEFAKRGEEEVRRNLDKIWQIVNE